MIPARWAKDIGTFIALRQQPDASILYEDESRYSHIAVSQDSDNPNGRAFYQDKLKHSGILMDNILDLQYFYTEVYAAVTEGLSRNKEKLSVMAIGGGGYVFPRYVEKVWPGSRIDVAEIDPAVTFAAMAAFGMPKNTTINTINMDARNYVDRLLEQKRSGQKIPQYDFIYGDAFNDYSVPFQLVTKQFNEKLSAILSDNGVYMINVIDIFDSGLFAGACINTLEKTFPYVYAATENESCSTRNTFVIIAAKNKLDLKNIISQYKGEKLKPWYLDASDIAALRQKSRQLVLTDDYSPVENLLAPVVRSSAKDVSAENFLKRAGELEQKGRFAESIENYLSAIRANHTFSIQLYNEIGIIYNRMGNLEQAAQAFNKAIRYNDESEHKINMAIIYYNLGAVLKKLGKSEQATEQLHKAVEEFQIELSENPTYHRDWGCLGDIFTTMGDFKAAVEACEKALALDPANPVYCDNLIKALEYDGQYDQAIEVLKKYIPIMKLNKQDEAASLLQKHLEHLEYKNSAEKTPD
jgi:tetratricopeptide (TPR) repeat protein